MKEITLKQVVAYFENSCLWKKQNIFYKNEDNEFVKVTPIFDENSNLLDLEDEDNNLLRDEFSISKIANLKFYCEEVE